MIKTFNVNPTPGLARKLLVYSSLSGIEIPEPVRELAANDLILEEEINSFFGDICPEKILDTVQYLNDFSGRCVILSENLAFGVISFMVHCKRLDKKPCCIVVDDISKIGNILKTVEDLMPSAQFKVIPDNLGAEGSHKIKSIFEKKEFLFVSKTTLLGLAAKGLHEIPIESMLLVSPEPSNQAFGSYPFVVLSNLVYDTSILLQVKDDNSQIINWDLISKINSIRVENLEFAVQFLYGEDFYFSRLLSDKFLIKYIIERNYEHNKIILLYLSGVSTQLL